MKSIRHMNRTGIGLVTAAFIAVTTLAYGGVAHAQEATDKQQTAQQAAEEKRAAAQKRAEEARAAAQQRAEEAKMRAEERVTETKQRLEGAKLKACEAREKRIEATMGQMTKRGENHIAVFTKIADRVKAFYEEKGRTVANYDELVAAVDTKKAAAEEAVGQAQSVSDVFSCDSDNPKIASQEFREAHQAQVAALKEYRTAVKNLIVGVKSAQSQAAKADQGTQSTESESSQSQTEGSTNE